MLILDVFKHRIIFICLKTLNVNFYAALINLFRGKFVIYGFLLFEKIAMLLLILDTHFLNKKTDRIILLYLYKKNRHINHIINLIKMKYLINIYI